MRFVVDDACWAPAGVAPEALADALESLCDRLDDTRSREETVGVHDTLYELQVTPMTSLTSALFEAEDPLELGRDLRRRLSVLLDKLPKRGDAEVVSFGVNIAGTRHATAPSVDIARARCARREETACLTPATSGRRGRLAVSPTDAEAPAAMVAFVVDAQDHVNFFREVITIERADEEGFATLAPSAWPGLAFVDGLWRGLRDFSRNYREIRDDLMKHLNALSDHGGRIFALGRARDIEGQFGSLGVTISPESTETMRDARCRNARTCAFEGESIVCEWHTKIELHQDRIHVHPPTARSDGRVIVGVLHRHLPIPGID